MSRGVPSASEPVETEATARERRRRLAAVFGDVLPDTTSDEREHEPGSGERDSEAWLRRQVPPHHGD